MTTTPQELLRRAIIEFERGRIAHGVELVRKALAVLQRERDALI